MICRLYKCDTDSKFSYIFCDFNSDKASAHNNSGLRVMIVDMFPNF